MRSLKRLGAAFFATSMLCTINVANAKIFVGTSQVAESVNLIDKDLIESQNNELIALRKKVGTANIGNQRITFNYFPKRKVLQLVISNKPNCSIEVDEYFTLSEFLFNVTKCIDDEKVSSQNERVLVEMFNNLRDILS